MFLIHLLVLTEYSGAWVALKLLFNIDNWQMVTEELLFSNTHKAEQLVWTAQALICFGARSVSLIQTVSGFPLKQMRGQDAFQWLSDKASHILWSHGNCGSCSKCL